MVRRRKGLYIFRGDSTRRDDVPVSDDFLIGRVDAVDGPRGRRDLTSSARFYGILRGRLAAGRHSARRLARRVSRKTRRILARRP
jgi:hypothetical protein